MGTTLFTRGGATAVQVIHFPKPFEHAHPPVRDVHALEAHHDDEFNRKVEEDVRAVLEHLSAQDEALAKIVETMATRMNEPAKG